MKKRLAFDKYDLYRRSVQDAEGTAEFLETIYRDEFRRTPRRLREDFCGTLAFGEAWVRRGPKHLAIGVDSDSEPLAYGASRRMVEMSASECARVESLRRVLPSKSLPKADIICALNFSYSVFHERKQLKAYFVNARAQLRGKGLLVIDCLPGVDSLAAMEWRLDYGDFTYFWNQASFDPITRRALYHIHFQRRGEKKRERVFTYDWRLYTVPELRDLMEEAGFRKTWAYSQESESGVWSAFVVAR